MEEMLKQFIQKFDDFKAEMLDFKAEMLDFKSDTTGRLERIERKLDATFEQVVVNSEDMTVIKGAAAHIADQQ
jgi:hypothetical protein